MIHIWLKYFFVQFSLWYGCIYIVEIMILLWINYIFRFKMESNRNLMALTLKNTEYSVEKEEQMNDTTHYKCIKSLLYT